MDIKNIWKKISYREDENLNEQIIEFDSESEEDQIKAENRRNLIKNIINGNWLTWDFFSQQRILILLIAILVIGYIDNRYRSEQERSHLAQLQKEVINKRYEDLEVSAQLVEMSRQSHVIERLKQYNSKLKESNTPAINLSTK